MNSNAAAANEPATPAGDQPQSAASGRGRPTVPVKPEPDFSGSSITDTDFEALRVQLAEVSEALARKASSETRNIKQLRSALASARDQLATLAEQASATPESPMGDMTELIAVARQAAENPRHLDYLTALAEQAGKIADALQNNSSPATGISASALVALRAQLDQALGD